MHTQITRALVFALALVPLAGWAQLTREDLLIDEIRPGEAISAVQMQARFEALLGAFERVNGRLSALEEELEIYRARSITVDTVLSVGPGQAFTEVQDALDSLRGKLIMPNATVTIRLEPGVLVLSKPVVVDHPDGQRIQLVGTLGNASAVTLRFAPEAGVVGIEVRPGSGLGLLAGLTLDGEGRDRTGIIVQQDARLTIQDLTVQQFGRIGVYVEGSLDGISAFPEVGGEGSTLRFINNGQQGVLGSLGAEVRLQGAWAHQNGVAGFQVSEGGKMHLVGALAEDSPRGIEVGLGAHLNCFRCGATLNRGTGFLIQGTAQLQFAYATNNEVHGVAVSGSLSAGDSVAEGNRVGFGYIVLTGGFAHLSACEANANGAGALQAERLSFIEVTEPFLSDDPTPYHVSALGAIWRVGGGCLITDISRVNNNFACPP